MQALAWHGKGDMRCDSVPDPRIEQPRDAIIHGPPEELGAYLRAHQKPGAVRGAMSD